MSSISGEYTRVGRPGWIRRKLSPNYNVFGIDDIYRTHDEFMDSLYALADDEEWAYTEESPEITVTVDGNAHTVTGWDDIEEMQTLKHSPVRSASSEWKPDIDADELGPIQELCLQYERQSDRFGRQESIGATVTVDGMTPATFDDLIDRMEEHYGTATEYPYRHLPDL